MKQSEMTAYLNKALKSNLKSVDVLTVDNPICRELKSYHKGYATAIKDVLAMFRGDTIFIKISTN